MLCLVLAENASFNAGNVSALDRQNLSKYSAGPCECHKTDIGMWNVLDV